MTTLTPDQAFADNVHRTYAYGFDYIVQTYLLRSLSPFFKPGGKALELGCFEGESTQRLARYFDDLTVLEAVNTLIETARANVPASVEFIHSTIETADLAPQFDAIFLVHTLEHLDDGVAAMSRIKQWLSPGGYFFVAVPNADAASRQIATKMGLIDTNNAVTEGEHLHGHRRTYSFDTLESEVRRAGLEVVTRGGVIFKGLANFQIDRALKENIIDAAYIEGCYALGMQYPELCSTIYMVCRRPA